MPNTKLAPCYPINVNLDDKDDVQYYSCEEDGDDESGKFFDFEPSQTFDNHTNDQLSTLPHIPFSENLNTNFVKPSLMQRILNWFRALVQHVRKAWLSNKLNNNDHDPIENRRSSIRESESRPKEVRIYENVIVTAALSNVDNKPILTPLSSHANAFYQEAKKEEDHHAIQALRYGLN